MAWNHQLVKIFRLRHIARMKKNKDASFLMTRRHSRTHGRKASFGRGTQWLQ